MKTYLLRLSPGFFFLLLTIITSCEPDEELPTLPTRSKVSDFQTKYSLREDPTITPESKNVRVFNTVEEAEAFMEKYVVSIQGDRVKNKVLPNLSNARIDPNELPGDSEGTAVYIEAPLSPFTDVFISFLDIYENGRHILDDFQSTLTGLTVGTSWQQARGSFSRMSNGLIKFEVLGYLELNILVEGIGNIGRYAVSIHGTYNPLTQSVILDRVESNPTNEGNPPGGGGGGGNEPPHGDFPTPTFPTYPDPPRNDPPDPDPEPTPEPNPGGGGRNPTELPA